MRNIKFNHSLGRPISTTRLKGGPYNSKWIYLSVVGTLVFSLDGFKGHYDFMGNWIEIKPDINNRCFK